MIMQTQNTTLYTIVPPLTATVSTRAGPAWTRAGPWLREQTEYYKKKKTQKVSEKL